MLIQLSGQTTQQGKLQELLSTHPDTYKRAAHIKQMCEAAGYSMTTPKANSTGSSNNNNTVSPKPNSGSNNSGTGTKPKTTTIKPKKG